MALLLYCRAGFEKECAAEITRHCAELGVAGFAKAQPEAGYLEFVPHEPGAPCRARFKELVFARQAVQDVHRITGLPPTDRITPLITAIRAHFPGSVFSEVWLETADTNAAKELSAFCRKFAPPLQHALRADGLLRDEGGGRRLHLFWLDSSEVYLGYTDPANSAPWPMGIPRLRLAREAPSRSALKLAEALLTFFDPARLPERLHEGMSAVDLGAAPGGWTWLLTQHGLHVTAVDNGALAPALMAHNLVEHVRADGLRYWPKRGVNWLVCDMVEKPSRVAQLVARWVAAGKCEGAIFNLKLPMKKRWEELQRCRDDIAETLDGVPYRLRFKQLYHDREEVTGLLQAGRR